MEKYMKKGIAQKIIITAIVMFMMLSIIMPTISRATNTIPQDDFTTPESADGGQMITNEIYGSTIGEIQKLLVGLGDAAMFMAGLVADGGNYVVVLSNGTGKISALFNIPILDNVTGFGAVSVIVSEAGLGVKALIGDDNTLPETIQIPIFRVSPELIFANKVPFLNANLFGEPVEGSVAKDLQSTISGWYLTFRNIAIVGMLSVLVYVAIRIMISSTATDKSRYKIMLKDWAVAFVLLFFMHYIMSFANTVIVYVTQNIDITMVSSGITEKSLEGYEGIGKENIPFNEDGTWSMSLTEAIRLNCQTTDKDAMGMGERISWTIMYLVVVIYTLMFLFIYLKRLVYLIFLTMIAPLVALTYPLDKIKDGSAQGFNTWLKEYMANLLIQPLHLILYKVLVSNAMYLAADHIIYPLVVMGFMLQSEKIIRKLFGIDKSSTASSLFSGAMGGAVVMKGIDWLGARAKGIAKSAAGGSSKSGGSDNIRMDDPTRKADAGKDLKMSNAFDIFAGGFGTGSKKAGAAGGTASSAAGSGTSAGSRTSKTNLPSLQARKDQLNSMLDDYNNNYDDINMAPYEDQLKYENYQKELSELNKVLGGGINMADMPDEGIMPDTASLEDFEDESEDHRIDLGEMPDEDNGVMFDDNSRDEDIRKHRKINGFKNLAKKYVLNEDVGMKALRFTAGAAGGLTLGTIGLAAGLASDDFSNTLKYTAAAGAIGAGVGSGGVKAISNNTGKFDEVVDTYKQGSMTKEEYQEYLNQKSDAMWRQNKEVERMFKEAYRNKKIRYKSGKVEEAWKVAMKEAQKMRQYGVTDNKVLISMTKDKLAGNHSDWTEDKWAMTGKLAQTYKTEKGIKELKQQFNEKLIIKETGARKKQLENGLNDYLNDIRKYSGRDLY